MDRATLGALHHLSTSHFYWRWPATLTTRHRRRDAHSSNGARGSSKVSVSIQHVAAGLSVGMSEGLAHVRRGSAESVVLTSLLILAWSLESR